MAFVRCQDHPPRNFNYEIAVKPVDYPDPALICGRGDDDHQQPGWVYLRPEEYEEYEAGKRVFGLWGADSTSKAAKVKVSDNVVEGLNRWNDDEEVEEDSSDNPLQSQSSIDRY